MTSKRPRPTTNLMLSIINSPSSSRTLISQCWKWAQRRSIMSKLMTVLSWRLQSKQSRWTRSKVTPFWGMIPRTWVTEMPLPTETSALTTKRSKSRDQTAPSTLATLLTISSWIRSKLTKLLQSSTIKEVQDETRASDKRSQQPRSNALAISSTLKIRTQGR